MAVQNLPGMPTLWVMFVIDVEILSNALEIYGIQIDQTNSIKITSTLIIRLLKIFSLFMTIGCLICCNNLKTALVS